MALKLHNAMWPGLVGKGDEEGQEPEVGLGVFARLQQVDTGVCGKRPVVVLP